HARPTRPKWHARHQGRSLRRRHHRGERARKDSPRRHRQPAATGFGSSARGRWSAGEQQVGRRSEMKIAHFFIDRPIFASVIAIVIMILGGVAFVRLPVAQYPEIAPPTINVTGQYPGASAETVAETVVAPIEQQINGVEGMLYISSNATADGRFTISVTFDLG